MQKAVFPFVIEQSHKRPRLMPKRISAQSQKMTAAPATDDEAAVVVLPIESNGCWIQRHHANDNGEPISIREWDDAAFRQTNGWHGHDLVHSATTSPVHVHSYRVECKSNTKNEC
jgi:hypothetical protein